MNEKDQNLMKEYQLGNNEAIKEIFKIYKVRIFYFCFRILNNRADAEEVAAEVFLNVINNKYLYDNTRTFSTWIYTIARNLSLNCIRKRKKMVSMWFRSTKTDNYQSWEIPDQRDDSRESLAKKERAQYVNRAIASLPFEQREALELKQYDKFSYVEISQILNCSLSKVKILIFRAKENLKRKLYFFIKEERT